MTTNRLTETEIAAMNQRNAAELEAVLATVGDETQREALRNHATIPGTCDAEYCPWQGFRESFCIRKQVHHRNCRCPDCCDDDDDYGYGGRP